MRKILVGIKRVIDYNVRVRVRPDGTGVVTDGVKMSINPFDEIALEEALRIKRARRSRRGRRHQHRDGRRPTAIAHCARDGRRPRHPREDGSRSRTVHGRSARAAQARRARAADHRDPRQAGHRRRLQPDGPDAGRDSGTARRRHLPRRSNSTAQTARVTREVDAGLEIIEVDLPAVVTTDLRLNEPRYVKLPGHHEGEEETAGRDRPGGARRRRRPSGSRS